MALETSPKAVKGGQTTMSSSLTLPRSRLMPFTKSSASATVLFIFQFPAMISLRSLSIVKFKSEFSNIDLPVLPSARNRLRLITQCGHPRQHGPFQKFQARPAARAHKGDLVGQAGLIERFHTVAPADDALGAILLRGLGHSLGDGRRAFGKSRVFEHSHRTIPQNRFRLPDDLAVLPD